MSSNAIASIVLATATLAGCDGVFGLSGGELKVCDDSSFATSKPHRVSPGYAFSVTWDRDRIFYMTGPTYEMSLPDGTPHAIDIGPYQPDVMAVSPEGDAMLFTVFLEPPELHVSLRASSTTWTADALVPFGTYAGTPTAAEFGPRRVLVRLRAGAPDVQEYEADGNSWRPVGDVHPIDGSVAPNLTPAGLDMVFAATIGSDSGVFIAHRASTAEWFGPPALILAGAHDSPQLLDRCRELYVVEASADPNDGGRVVVRYDR
jgi:hypothetical protein